MERAHAIIAAMIQIGLCNHHFPMNVRLLNVVLILETKEQGIETIIFVLNILNKHIQLEHYIYMPRLIYGILNTKESLDYHNKTYI